MYIRTTDITSTQNSSWNTQQIQLNWLDYASQDPRTSGWSDLQNDLCASASSTRNFCLDSVLFKRHFHLLKRSFIEQCCSENCLEMLENLASSRAIAFEEWRRMEVEPGCKKIRCSTEEANTAQLKAKFMREQPVFVKYKSFVKSMTKRWS